jgi:hypothetical protein
MWAGQKQKQNVITSKRLEKHYFLTHIREN